MNATTTATVNSIPYISDARLDQLIQEDLPYMDLTAHILGIGDRAGAMEYYTREACVLCCTEEASRILTRLGCTIEWSLPSGTKLEAGQSFLRVTGSAASLHAAWKVCLNFFDHYSAVATKTRKMVDAAHAANPACEVLTTRKSTPGNKDLLTHAILTGGAFPHRMGLSETVLVFDNHVKFMSVTDGAGTTLTGLDAFIHELPVIRRRCIEKKLFVEATAEDARRLVRAGVDGIQFDKVAVNELAPLVEELHAIDPHVALVAAGGIRPDNAGEYAATGVDGLVTTSCFTAKPIDMSVKMEAC